MIAFRNPRTLGLAAFFGLAALAPAASASGWQAGHEGRNGRGRESQMVYDFHTTILHLLGLDFES